MKTHINNDFNIPELLSPAGNEECLNFALDFGADAVYLGSTNFGMRASSKNFTLTGLKTAVETAHKRGAKIYLTCNIIPHNDEIVRFPAFLEEASSCGIDALIITDLGVLALAKKYAPKTDIHISTQFGVTNYASAQMLYELGATRIVLSRELSLNEIVEIRSRIPKTMQIECFVHGAMCVSFSGRCLISNYLAGRDANRGDCAQPCRWKYNLMEETRPGVYLPVLEDEEGTYILNAKDLCMIHHLPELAEAGINSFKIEGRAKNGYYTAVVTNAYRNAIDSLTSDQSDPYKPAAWVYEELNRISHRDYCTGFFFGNPKANAQIYYNGGYIREWDLAAIVANYENGFLTVIQRNKFFNDDVLEVLEPGKEPFQIVVRELQSEDVISLDCAAHPMMTVKFKCETDINKNAILRKELKKTNIDFI